MKTLALAGCLVLLVQCGPPPGAFHDGGSDDSSSDGAPNDALTDAPTDAPADTSSDSGTPSPLVSPTCIDGMYTETLPNLGAAIDDVPFSASNLETYYDTVLGRRYPNGQAIVRGGLMNTSVGNCVQIFSGSPTNATDALGSLNVVVHECGHLYDSLLGAGAASTNVYYFTSATRFSCTRGDTTTRGGDTFARSLLDTDAYSSMRPPCGGTASPTCDMYADIYLNGSPTNSTFESGDQGFNMLLEEDVQYINSLATSWTYADHLPSGESTSARDGILTFLWYVERYLHMARLMYPTAYTRLSGDDCWRHAILTVWGRAWLYLQQTDGMRDLGINDQAIMPLVMTPELLDEIARIRMAAGCP